MGFAECIVKAKNLLKEIEQLERDRRYDETIEAIAHAIDYLCSAEYTLTNKSGERNEKFR
jgi:hypothetical protein